MDCGGWRFWKGFGGLTEAVVSCEFVSCERRVARGSGNDRPCFARAGNIGSIVIIVSLRDDGWWRSKKLDLVGIIVRHPIACAQVGPGRFDRV